MSARASCGLAPIVMMDQQHMVLTKIHVDGVATTATLESRYVICGSGDGAKRRCSCTARPEGGHGRLVVTSGRPRGSADGGACEMLDMT